MMIVHDDSIEFICNNTNVLSGVGNAQGDWGDYSQDDGCLAEGGICGIQTRQRPQAGKYIDTAVHRGYTATVVLDASYSTSVDHLIKILILCIITWLRCFGGQLGIERRAIRMLQCCLNN